MNNKGVAMNEASPFKKWPAYAQYLLNFMVTQQ